jgi:hypothetical protein
MAPRQPGALLGRVRSYLAAEALRSDAPRLARSGAATTALRTGGALESLSTSLARPLHASAAARPPLTRGFAGAPPRLPTRARLRARGGACASCAQQQQRGTR